ncbi:unnamed protein product [Durusdinium trenchii]|uniref:Uncharacterized protein n=1 Tax=Durusdinium trenchii TaxID=1381693 RepID=A0ABP0QIE2_9DINO
MLFSKHLQERAAKKLLAGKRCRALLVWTLTLMMALSASTIPLLGALTSPLVFGCGVFLLYAPAAFRARSLLKPILYPATVILPAGESLFRLDPKSRPAKCFYMFTLVVRFTAVAGLWQVYHLIFSWQADLPVVKNVFSMSHQWGDLDICCHEYYLQENGPTYFEDCSSNESYANCTFHCYDPPQLPDGWMLEPDGCLLRFASEEACIQKAPMPSPSLDTHICWENSTMPDWKDVCSRLIQVPQYLECSLCGLSGRHAEFALTYYLLCQEKVQWIIGNMCPLIVYGTKMFLIHGSVLFVQPYTFGILCAILTSPFFATILLVLISCCFPAVPCDVEFRLAVDAEARRMQEELNEAGTAPLSMLGRGLLRLDLMLMFVDFAGDIFSVFSFVAKGHVWFGIFLGLIVLRSVVDIVKLQRQTGLLKEVQMSLRANTLTNRVTFCEQRRRWRAHSPASC